MNHVGENAGSDERCQRPMTESFHIKALAPQLVYAVERLPMLFRRTLERVGHRNPLEAHKQGHRRPVGLWKSLTIAVIDLRGVERPANRHRRLWEPWPRSGTNSMVAERDLAGPSVRCLL